MQKLDVVAVRVERAKRNWGQKDLATAARIRPETVSNAEGGKWISLRTTCRIASALGCPVSRLLTPFTPA